jgi:hypothetical protein
MPCNAMHPIQDLFLESFSYVLQIDMHFICTPMWTKFYSYKCGCYNATQWQNIDSRISEFIVDPRNIRIAMSTDGMNPFMNIAQKHMANCADDFEPSSFVLQQTEIYYDVRIDTGATTTWE